MLRPDSDTAVPLGSASYRVRKAAVCAACPGHSLERLWILLSTGVLTFKTTVLEPQGTLWLIFPFSVYNATKVQRDSGKGRHCSAQVGNEEWTMAQRQRHERDGDGSEGSGTQVLAVLKPLCGLHITQSSWHGWQGLADGEICGDGVTSPNSHIWELEMILNSSGTRNLVALSKLVCFIIAFLYEFTWQLARMNSPLRYLFCIEYL